MSDDDLIWRGDAVAMLLAMRGPVDVPRTEKAVWVDEGIDRCIEELRDMPAVTVGVKPLVWEGEGHWHSGDNEGWLEEANTPFGWGYAIEFGNLDNGPWVVSSTFGETLTGFDSPDAAKTAAQADYEARILAALEPTDAAHVNETPKAEHDGADVLTAAIRAAALREAEEALRDWQDSLNTHRSTETAITVGMAADVVLDLIDKEPGNG